MLAGKKLLCLENGEQLFTLCHRDIMALEMASREKFKICLLQRRAGFAVFKAVEAIKGLFFIGEVKSKIFALENFILENDMPPNELLYIGAEIDDLAAMKFCPVKFATADAHELAKENANHITLASGGDGAVAEVIDMLFSAQKLSFN